MTDSPVTPTPRKLGRHGCDPNPSREGRPIVVNKHGATLYGPFPGNYNLDYYKWETDFLLLETCPISLWAHEGHGKPPDCHPNRCQGKKRKHFPPQQCKKVALRGKYFCQFHAGRTPNSPNRSFDAVMSIYAKNASPRLKELLEQVKTPERRSLDDEIDLARAMVDRSLKIFEVTCITQADKASSELKVAAVSNLRQAIALVTETAYKSSKIRVQEEAVLDAEQLKMFVEMVTNLIEQCVESHRDKVALIEGLRGLKMPRSKDRLTPDEFAEQTRQVLAQMRGTVPTTRTAEPEPAGPVTRPVLELVEDTGASVEEDFNEGPAGD